MNVQGFTADAPQNEWGDLSEIQVIGITDILFSIHRGKITKPCPLKHKTLEDKSHNTVRTQIPLLQVK